MRLTPLIAKFLQKTARLIDPFSESVGKRICPICDFEGKFLSFGIIRRPDARCPSCGSLERERLFKLMIDRLDLLPSNCRLIHFAPEAALSRIVRPLCSEYITTDLIRDDVDINLNIEALELENGSFDALICSDVLEHVDDAAALGECFRILTSGGLAILHVPIIEGWEKTYEDPRIVEESDRLLHFGQRDHLRLYGRDFRDRVRSAGFELEEFVAEGTETVTYSLGRDERWFLARKPYF